MLCEKCNKNEARVHVVKVVNGKKSDIWLCEKCAKKISEGSMIPFIFEGDNEQAGEKLFNLLNEVKKKKSEIPSKIDIICKSCGLTFSKFRETQELGCTECYESFSEELKPFIEEKQGSSAHVGKIPKREEKNILRKSEIEELEKLLKNAIDNENYELAAVLRDKLKSIRGEECENEQLDV